MAIVWSYFHKKRVPGSDLSTNFLIVAPNVIVYQRLEKDFASNRIFHELPLVPPEWRGSFSQKVILRGEATEPDPSGNLFLTNIHQLYESRDEEWTPRERGRRAARAEAGQGPRSRASARCWSGSSRSRTSSCSTMKPTMCTTRIWLGASRCSRSTGRCPRASLSGSTSPPRRRTRTGCTSPGRSATTRSPRRSRTASSKRR